MRPTGYAATAGTERVQMTGWSKSIDAKEAEGAAALDLEELPVYETCSTCGGSGKVPRSQWSSSLKK